MRSVKALTPPGVNAVYDVGRRERVPVNLRSENNNHIKHNNLEV